jgi:endonuclease YncB( thermonuclease family)
VATAKMCGRLGFCRMLLVTLPVAAEAIEICKGGNRAERAMTCLVDGDTGWEAGVKWRLKGVDTPEYAANAECAQEPEFAKSATYRMIELMFEGYSVEWLGESDGSRELVRVKLPDGRDAGTVLISEGHAIPWPHTLEVWCR